MSNVWYEILSVLHLMAMLSLSQANLLLLPRISTDGYQPEVSDGKHRLYVSVDGNQLLPFYLIILCSKFSRYRGDGTLFVNLTS